MGRLDRTREGKEQASTRRSYTAMQLWVSRRRVVSRPEVSEGYEAIHGKWRRVRGLADGLYDRETSSSPSNESQRGLTLKAFY